MTVTVVDVCGSPYCITHREGNCVRDKIEKFMRRGDWVVLDFSGVIGMTSVFLDAAAGELYSRFSPEQIAERLSVVCPDKTNRNHYELVMSGARKYFTNAAHREAVNAVVSGAMSND